MGVPEEGGKCGVPEEGGKGGRWGSLNRDGVGVPEQGGGWGVRHHCLDLCNNGKHASTTIPALLPVQTTHTHAHTEREKPPFTLANLINLLP